MAILTFILSLWGILAVLFNLPGAFLLWTTTALVTFTLGLMLLIGLCSRNTLAEIFESIEKQEIETGKNTILARRIIGFMLWAVVIYCAMIAYPAHLAWFISAMVAEIMFIIIYSRYKAAKA